MSNDVKSDTESHTEGPWCVSSVHPLEVWGTGLNGFKIAVVTDNEDNPRDPVAMADARLIAAAPDLLAMCQRMLTALNAMPDKSGGGDTLDRQLTAVIAKALGK